MATQPSEPELGGGAQPASAPPAKLSKRSIALHTGYVGTGYKGSSINRCLAGDAVTIEQVLETAMHKAGFISDANYGSFSKIKWSRASRTDKGVHSLGTVMGLRMLVDDSMYQAGRDTEGIAAAEAINAHLPPQIRVFCAQKTNKKFHARHMCEGRTYQYYLPASMLELKGDGSAEDSQRIETFREALRYFEGAHPFHNYTKMRAYSWESSNVPYRGRGQKRAFADGGGDGPAGSGAAPDTAAAAAAAPGADGNSSAADAAAGGGSQSAATTPPVDQQGGPGAGAGPAGDAASQEPDAKRQRTGEEATAAAAAQPGTGDGGDGGDGIEGSGWGRGRGRGRGGGRGGGGGGRGGGKRRGGGSDDDDDSNEDDNDGEPAGGELDDSDEEGGDGGGAAGGTDGGAAASGRTPRRAPTLRWQADFNSRDKVTQTYYRKVASFTAQDPEPLVEGGQPCLLLTVEGQSFMLHHIRHMVGTAVAVALGLIPKELLEASLACPTRVTLPRAPPHTLLLSDCSFHAFPQQFGPGNNDLNRVSGERLTLRAMGRKAQEDFRKQVLAPALEHLAELAEWRHWKASLQQQYPFPQEVLEPFLEQYRAWGEAMAAKRKAREERTGEVGVRGRQAKEQH